MDGCKELVLECCIQCIYIATSDFKKKIIILISTIWKYWVLKNNCQNE